MSIPHFRPWHRSRLRDALVLRRLRGQRKRAVVNERRSVAPDGPAVVVGALATASGIGNGARLMLADLGHRDVLHHAVDITRELGLKVSEPNTRGVAAGDALPSLPRIVHLNPPHFARGLGHLGASVFAEPVVAYWAWELEQAPREWLASALLADEIWVPSAFVRDALRRTFGDARGFPGIRVVPHVVAAGEPFPRNTESRNAVHRTLGFSAADFVAGFSFSMLAGVERKNPKAAITAFKEAFSEERDHPRLLLRCVDADKNRNAWGELLQLVGDDKRIRLIYGEALSIHDFFGAIDVLLSLQRSEGYGLTLSEALLAGIPVISTDWSLPVETTRHPKFYAVPFKLVSVLDPTGPYKNFRHQRWAEPDLAAASHCLRALYTLRSYPEPDRSNC